MADVQQGGSMGVTALLDELLATGCGREPPPSSPVYDPREPVAPEHFGCGSETATPRSRELAELCGEMDTCLASLGKWEEESRLRVEALRKDLEAKYGFAFDPHAGRPAAWEDTASPADESPNGSYRHLLQSEELVSEAYCRALSSGAPFEEGLPGSPGSLMATSPLRGSPRPLPAAAADATRADDEARIARLRAEVEELRRREQQMQQDMEQEWLELQAAAGEGEGEGEDAEPAAEAAASAASAASGAAASAASACFGGTASELSALCREADGWLRDHPSPGRLAPGADAADVPREFAALEARLAQAQGGIKHMEAVLGSARSAVDSELSELERMLANEDKAAAGGS